MNTIKMPRKHNQRIKEIQRQKKCSEDLKETILTLVGAFFVVMCLWGATEFAEWIGQIIHENQMYKVERQIEASQLYVRLTADKVEEKRKEDERKKAIADLCKRDKHGCNIILTRW